MGRDERAGAGTGQPDHEPPDHPSAGWTGYLLRGLLSAGALTCAGLILATLGEVAAPLPDRGLAAPTPAAIAAPAALPTVPEPVRSGPDPGQAPASQAGPKRRGPQSKGGTRAKPDLSPASSQIAFTAWSGRVAPFTGISPRALKAYATAHAAMAATEPKCQITWVTLAGIAFVESNHGTIGGRTLLPDGRESSPVIGVPLNGAPGVRTVADTDGGRLDGDPVWDHAIGPFQFTPSTWAAWRSDGNGDGIADPQNIDDSAIAAARYLCAAGHNLASGEGWLQAIMSYNNSVPYVQQVYYASQGYARSAQGHG